VLRESKVTVKIPRPLYRKIQLVIESSGFSSPTDFIVFVLRDLLGEADRKNHDLIAQAQLAAAAAARVPRVLPPTAPATATVPATAEDFSPNDLENIKQKLRNLGYL
jgi:Arc/MetJ-type ribon-helix-helix transcriptional regulator